MRRRFTIPLLSLALPAVGLLMAASPAASRRPPAKPTPSKVTATSPGADSFQREIVPLLKKYCVSCHGDQTPAAGLSLAWYRDRAKVLKARDVWEKVGQNVRIGRMPPPGVPRPTKAERERISHWVEATLSQADCEIRDPGRVTMRRLNREEYNNTVRDLLGVTLRPADQFPSDDVGYGYDNIGDVLSISPLLMEKYISAAEKIAQAAVVTRESASPTVRFDKPQFAEWGGSDHSKGRILTSAGELAAEIPFAGDGEYAIRIRAFGDQAGPEPVRMAVRIDGQNVRLFDVKATEKEPGNYELRTRAAAGKRRLAVVFLNDFYDPGSIDEAPRDRNLILQSVEIQGPIGLPANLPPSHRRLFAPAATATGDRERAIRILEPFARRAYRRPVTKSEVERLVRWAAIAQKNGESFERSIQLAVQAVLCSPHFLFRVETEPKVKSASMALGDFELASRLSYFLWSSMPDDRLFSLAAKGRLRDPETLAAETRRMLKDSKARALATNFGSQWLTLRRLAEVAPDPGRFPEFNETLRTAMRGETERFFEAIIREDRSILDLLEGRFTYLNEPLAKLYGVPGVKGEQFRRVALTGGDRLGILTQASVLTVTSNPTRTSPVKRGKWVMEQILGTPPPPPPPGVPELADDKEKKGPLIGTLRQRMEQHRKNPMCASCHTQMDAIGFGLENFDPIGRWRTRDGDSAIDSSGVMPDGRRFRGPKELIETLKAQKSQFVRNLSQQVLTYALGRGLEPYDNCHIQEISRAAAREKYRFSALVVAVVQSSPFRERRGSGASPAPTRKVGRS